MCSSEFQKLVNASHEVAKMIESFSKSDQAEILATAAYYNESVKELQIEIAKYESS